MPDNEKQNNPPKSPDEKEAAGMPPKDTIIEVKPLTSPKGKRYRILRTVQTDAYDRPQQNEPGTNAPE